MALDFLKKNYECLLLKKYPGGVLFRDLELRDRKMREAERILKYERFFKEILIKDYKERIKSFLHTKGISRCAIYGKTQITDVFVIWFKEWGIDIEYIVENWVKNPTYKEIPLIKRDDRSLVNCENMIICDANDEEVKEKLIRLGFDGVALSYNDLIR